MLVNSILVYQQSGSASTTSPAGAFDSVGAAGPINPLSNWGGRGSGAERTSSSWWAAVAMVVTVAAEIYIS